MIARHRFQQFALEAQLEWVFRYGTFLATRYEEEDTVALYHLGSFFAEIYFDQLAGELVRCDTFVSKENLEDYAVYIDLPEW